MKAEQKERERDKKREKIKGKNNSYSQVNLVRLDRYLRNKEKKVTAIFSKGVPSFLNCLILSVFAVAR